MPDFTHSFAMKLHQVSFNIFVSFIGKQFNFTGPKYALLHNILVYKRFWLNSQKKITIYVNAISNDS